MKEKIQVYRFGGSIRSYFLGQEANDLDLVVIVDKYSLLKDYICSQGYEILKEKQNHYIRARKDKVVVDFSYTDNIISFLSTRDFTANAISINVYTGEIIDPYDGRRDIENKILRPVGDVNERMEEDPLRIIRAIRFISQLGFRPSYNLKLYLRSPEASEQIKRVELERIRQELERAFRYDTSKTLESLYINCHRGVADYIFGTGLWLLPTTKDK